jgi:hypothetical protein
LTGYDGTAAAGTWQLTVSNLALATGTIDSWSVVLTYAGTCDYDSDGVEDHRDSCLGKAGHTASGCPAASRSLSAKYKRHKFRGVLSSTVRGCTAGRAVSIWKVGRGLDRQLGAATSASDGRYALKRAKHRGRYYAKSPRVVLAGVAECPAVTSATFRIR